MQRLIFKYILYICTSCHVVSHLGNKRKIILKLKWKHCPQWEGSLYKTHLSFFWNLFLFQKITRNTLECKTPGKKPSQFSYFKGIMCRTSSVHASYLLPDMCYTWFWSLTSKFKQVFDLNQKKKPFGLWRARQAEVRTASQPWPQWKFDIKIQLSWENTTHSTFKNTL